MEFSEYTRIVFNRINKIEPENFRKIIGYLLFHDHSDQEMARLALGPDHYIHEVVYRAKAEMQQLGLNSVSLSSPSPSPSPVGFARKTVARPPFPSPENFHAPSSWDQQQLTTNKRSPDFIPLGYSDSMFELQNQAQFFSLEDHVEPPPSLNSGLGLSSFDCSSYSDNAAMVNNLSSSTPRTARHFSALPEFQPKTCHYFNKGFCKHGNSCRYVHGNLLPDSLAQMYSSSNSVNDDQVFSPGSLETLEFEIVELLKSRRGTPISIASLPMIYYEKYGKVLQAEGYLTESQRHGKSGYSLTKLLARLKGSIRLIDRPHGQHAVILAEDSPKFMDNRTDKNDPGPIVSGSKQIYLTFPAESTFTEDDVSNYFNNTFGLVEDVRIPCQQRRMFGFVTFHSADTVKMILSKGNPHFVCGARVLVKPYREKSKLFDRKYQDRIEQQIYYSSHYADLDSELHSIPRGYETSRMVRMEEQQEQQALERRLSELNLMQKSIINQPYFTYSMNELKVPEEHFSFPTTERFDHLLDVLKSGSGSTGDDNKPPRNTTGLNHSDLDLDSQGFNLPDSPFASPIGSDTSTRT